MELILWFMGMLIAVVSVYFISTLFYMMFIARITELRIKFSSEYKILTREILVSEVNNNKLVMVDLLKSEVQTSSRTMLLDKNKLVDKTNNYFGEGKLVQVFDGKQDTKNLVFCGNEVFESTDSRLGSLFGEFCNPKLKRVTHVVPISDNYWLLTGTPDISTYPERFLYSVKSNTLRLVEISGDIYRDNSKTYTTLAFSPPKFQGVVVVYYSGSWQYDFSGSARPKYSVIRIYNREFSEGIDIAKFSLKSGVIIDVRFDGKCLILKGDPRRPEITNKQNLPPRYWKVTFR